MTVYLQIFSDSRHSRSIPTADWVAQLLSWPQLRVKNADWACFEVLRDGEPCAILEGFACKPNGSYSIRATDPPPQQINLIELRFAYSECAHEGLYHALAVRLAEHLGWEAWGEDEDGRELCLYSRVRHFGA